MEKIFFEEFPDKTDNQFYKQGSSPELLNKLLELLESSHATAIYVSFYLFNNWYIYQKLTELANRGVKVHVVSIPLEGYDGSKPKHLVGFAGGSKSNKPHSKKSLAEIIYADYCSKQHKNFMFYVFPHVYVRSKRMRRFSRGSLPYSLHVKSMLIVEKSSFTTVLSSSNFAVRDLRKFDYLYIRKTNKNQSSKEFYTQLINHSIPLKEFDENENYEFNYPIRKTECVLGDKSIFSAPFFFDSNSRIESLLIAKLKSAKELIVICAQHLAAYQYRYQIEGESVNKKGILFEALKNNRAKKVFISQTYSMQGVSLPDVRKPANTKQFQAFADAVQNNAESAYRVNSNIHSKFLIIDDDVFLSSANFTPTQFIYLPEVKIGRFDYDKTKSYYGTHSEIAHFEQTNNKEIREALLAHCRFIEKHPSTHIVKNIGK